MSFFLTETSASSSSTMAEHLKLRRPTRSQTSPDPVSEIPSLMQSTRSKSVVSSLFLPTDNETTKKKSNPFSQSTLRGLGCTASASQQVSVPALIRSSADWEAKKVKKKKKKSSKRVGNESNKVHHRQLGVVLNEGSGYNMSCGVIQDVWCGPGIGLSADAVGSVDRVVARRNVPARGKIDLEKLNHREMMMLQNNLIMGARDRFSEWRLDIDSMSYEQLLELGDKIGYVNTGLKEDEMSRCLRKMKGSIMGNKCIICQEEDDEEMGKLCCGHSFHIECIKQWLVHKNTCPVCKTEATPRC
ncbi:NEP1-interacting protein-like 2 isoform X2 [Hibiscus syriacus]|uniref:NEP1-interacting protein-like 2 isoform X2 n=1 Tax=Hibiscus syriacus TaxID=106335 RepID=UPI001923C960|nr:NEP1-interacting protein-like 2 isoform X2 [Hibiscus syriacus]